jgi:hypothetical protein
METCNDFGVLINLEPLKSEVLMVCLVMGTSLDAGTEVGREFVV